MAWFGPLAALTVDESAAFSMLETDLVRFRESCVDLQVSR